MQLRRDETLRQELSRKVEFKNERMAAIEEQRRSLMEELEDTPQGNCGARQLAEGVPCTVSLYPEWHLHL